MGREVVNGIATQKPQQKTSGKYCNKTTRQIVGDKQDKPSNKKTQFESIVKH